MSMIMPRKAAEFWWNLPIKGIEREPFVCPPNVARYERDEWKGEWRVITWKDIHKERSKRIKMNIEGKRMPDTEEVKPCVVWVFFVDSWLMGGYYTIIKSLHKEWYLNFRGQGLSGYVTEDELKRQVMEAFPLCIPLPEIFNDGWMKLFSKKYSNPHFYKYRKIQGTAIAWCKLDRYGNLMAISADKNKLKNTLNDEN